MRKFSKSARRVEQKGTWTTNLLSMYLCKRQHRGQKQNLPVWKRLSNLPRVWNLKNQNQQQNGKNRMLVSSYIQWHERVTYGLKINIIEQQLTNRHISMWRFFLKRCFSEPYRYACINSASSGHKKCRFGSYFYESITDHTNKKCLSILGINIQLL